MEDSLLDLCCVCIWTLDPDTKAFQEADSILGMRFGIHTINVQAWIETHNRYPKMDDLFDFIQDK